VKQIRERVYPEPRLAKATGKKTAESKRAKKERVRRKGARELNEELSQYYPLAGNAPEWGCPALLVKGKHGRERH
jgi:hypothetical protein